MFLEGDGHQVSPILQYSNTPLDHQFTRLLPLATTCLMHLTSHPIASLINQKPLDIGLTPYYLSSATFIVKSRPGSPKLMVEESCPERLPVLTGGVEGQKELEPSPGGLALTPSDNGVFRVRSRGVVTDSNISSKPFPG